GYLNRPELTAERFIQNPFVDDLQARLYRTGDLARYRPDGTIEFLGRADFQVKIRGFRIELGEIEALLNENTAVREAVVVAREDTPGDKRLVAYLIPQTGAKISVGDLRDSLREHLPEFMVPAHFVTMDKFPLTPNKKTDRKALPAPDMVQAMPETAYVPPSSDLEETIATIWKELLGIAQVGMNDNFFDLGGHSLLTVQAHRRLRDVIEQDISVTDMFRFPTIRSLADFLNQQGNGQAEARVQQSEDRAATRRAALAQRQQMRQRRGR
ncbi:MAG: AMP-binding protein, partial [Anaerolineales bacterium]|nr:AMP-binding protein [Anaerolineales bacterium]